MRAPRLSRGRAAPIRSGRSARIRSSSAVSARADEPSWAEALGAALAGLPNVQVVDEGEATEGDEPMRPTVGSILQYTIESRGWIARLSDEDGEEWFEPVVGWAVVVIWAAYDANAEDTRAPGDESEFQSDVQPMMFTRDGTTELMMFREGVTLEALVMPGYLPGASEK